MPNKLSKERKARVLGYILKFSKLHKYPPSVREICRGCNISSTAHASFILGSLERAGLIDKTPNISRGIFVTEAGKAELNSPNIHNNTGEGVDDAIS